MEPDKFVHIEMFVLKSSYGEVHMKEEKSLRISKTEKVKIL